MKEDFLDLLDAFQAHDVIFLLVGAHALVAGPVYQMGLPPRRIDAIDDRAATFYQRYGFTAVHDNDRRWVLKMSDIAAASGR